MNEYNAIEQVYKNGYEQCCKDCKHNKHDDYGFNKPRKPIVINYHISNFPSNDDVLHQAVTECNVNARIVKELVKRGIVRYETIRESEFERICNAIIDLDARKNNGD